MTTKKFKDYYDLDTALLIADKLQAVHPKFDVQKFLTHVTNGIEGKEFLDRQDAYVNAFEECLEGNYQDNIALFTEILGPELQTDTGMFTYGYWLWPIGRYVERHGTKNFQASMNFIYELTKRFTGEFAIRPIIARYPKQTFDTILNWSTDKSVHVRRLSSEGIRISLPWSKKSLVCLDEFDTYKKILTNLKDDKSKFVQKSVGNNLNDLYKINSEKAMEIIQEWQNDVLSKEALWIIKHGLRSMKEVVISSV